MLAAEYLEKPRFHFWIIRTEVNTLRGEGAGIGGACPLFRRQREAGLVDIASSRTTRMT